MDCKRTCDGNFHSSVEKLISVIISKMDTGFPLGGKFKGATIRFDIPSTKNEGYMIVEPWLTGISEQRRLRIGVCRKGYDKLHLYYLIHDTKEKVIEYLTADGAVEKLVQYYQSLSDSADNDD